jgi:hypothetical protein
MMAARPVVYQSQSKQDPYLARMWRRIILVAAVGLTPIVAPAPAMAAVPSPVPAQIAPVQKAPQQDCAQVKQLASLAKGKGGNVMCISRVSPATVKPDATTMEVGGCGNDSWVFGRHSACKNEGGYVLNVYAVTEGGGVGNLVGQMFHSVTSSTVTSGASARWTHFFTVHMGYAWGAVSGTSVYAFAECEVSCGMIGGTFDFGPVNGGDVRDGRAIFETSSYGFGSVWQAASFWSWQFGNPAWANPVTGSATIYTPAHRCDEAIGTAGSIGCVYIQKRPLHEIYMSRFPKYARHIQLAINFGLPSVLTRTQIRAQNDANRAKACPQAPANGWSCDEYPFASTQEGAANPMHPYGRTFQILNWNTGNPPFYCGVSWLVPRLLSDSRGYSVCGIPLEENVGGGTDLGVFYFANRVLHNDTFTVKVI